MFKYNVLSILLAVGALVLAYLKIPGWGWFLFVSLLVFTVPKNE